MADRAEKSEGFQAQAQARHDHSEGLVRVKLERKAITDRVAVGLKEGSRGRWVLSAPRLMNERSRRNFEMSDGGLIGERLVPRQSSLWVSRSIKSIDPLRLDLPNSSTPSIADSPGSPSFLRIECT